MKLFFRYLHQHRRGLLLAGLFCVIFCVSFLLYHLPVGAVLYPALLLRSMTSGASAGGTVRSSGLHSSPPNR